MDIIIARDYSLEKILTDLNLKSALRRLFVWDNKMFGCYPTNKNVFCTNQILVKTTKFFLNQPKWFLLAQQNFCCPNL